MSEFKVGDTVDPRTLPVGAEFKHLGNEANVPLRVVVAGQTAEMVGDFDHGPGRYNISDTLAVVLSLPDPIADEVVELGTLENDVCFDWDPAEDTARRMYPGPRRVTFSGKQLVRHTAMDGSDGQTHRNLALRVRRVPAPTVLTRANLGAGGGVTSAVLAASGNGYGNGYASGTAGVSGGSAGGCDSTTFTGYGGGSGGTSSASVKRPPCDACGEESTCTLQLNALGSVATCDRCANNREYPDFARDVRARRAKQTSTGSGDARVAISASEPVASPLPMPQDNPTEPRWQTTDTVRLEEEARRQPFTRRDLAESLLSLQPGPRLMRHELPQDQRCDRKRTGR